MAQKKVREHRPGKNLADRNDGPDTTPARPGLTLADAVEDFLEAQRANRRSPKTIEAQRATLGQLVTFARENDWPPVGEITQRHLRKYMNYLQERPRWFGTRGLVNGVPSRISVAHYDTVYRRFRRFFNFLLDQREVTENWMLHIDQPALGEKIVPIVEEDQVRMLLGITNPRNATSKRQHFHMTRDHAAFWFFVDTSARRSGFATCQVDDLDLQEGRILVLEKGSKERYLSLDRHTVKALHSYIYLRDQLKPWTGNLWVDEFGEPMEANWIYQMMKRRAAQVGIKDLHPHRFRHTFITRMIEDDVSQTTIEQMAGVTRIPRTYLNKIGWKQVRAAHRQHSPAAKIAQKMGRMR